MTGTDTTQTDPTHEIVNNATGLVEHLRAGAADHEQARRLPPAVFDALSEAGILKMCVPARFGGAELDFGSQCRALAEVARGCPSASWVATIFSAIAWTAGTFPDQAQEEIFADGDPRISGVLAPSGTLEPTDGGYKLSGTWGYNTGGHGSTWTLIHALAEGVPHICFVETAELQHLDDWYASGMAGTGSSSVVADDVFVPSYRAQPTPNMIAGDYTTDRHNADNPYFNLPFVSVLAVNAGGTPLGIAQGAMEAFMERMPGRGITYTDYEDQSAAPITHLQVGEASLLTTSARAHVAVATDILDRAVARAAAPSMDDRVKCRTHIAYATGLCREAVDMLFSGSSASAIQLSVPIQRIQRDIQALSNHALMHAHTGIEMHGRVLCGLEPNSPLV